MFNVTTSPAIRHTHTKTGLLWTSDQLVLEAATYTTHNLHNRRTSIPSAGLEHAILFTTVINAKRCNNPILKFAFMVLHMYLVPCPISNTECTKSFQFPAPYLTQNAQNHFLHAFIYSLLCPTTVQCFRFPNPLVYLRASNS